MGFVKYKPVIYKDGIFYNVKPYIIKVTNMGVMPTTSLLTNSEIPYLTNTKEFFVTTDAVAVYSSTGAEVDYYTDGNGNYYVDQSGARYTANEGDDNYYLYEKIPYDSFIYHYLGDIPNNSLITADGNSTYAFITANSQFFVVANA